MQKPKNLQILSISVRKGKNHYITHLLRSSYWIYGQWCPPSLLCLNLFAVSFSNIFNCNNSTNSITDITLNIHFNYYQHYILPTPTFVLQLQLKPTQLISRAKPEPEWLYLNYLHLLHYIRSLCDIVMFYCWDLVLKNDPWCLLVFNLGPARLDIHNFMLQFHFNLPFISCQCPPFSFSDHKE